MALPGSKTELSGQAPNKEPEWSSICEDIFDKYLNAEELFILDPDTNERSSSEQSPNALDLSGGSQQSEEAQVPSSISSPGMIVNNAATTVEARHPKAREPPVFWEKTVLALERNAAGYENKKQISRRVSKSQPDFRNLVAVPSSPSIASSPTIESFSAQRRMSRAAASGSAPGNRRNTRAISVSHGRPAGIVKPATVETSAANLPQRLLHKKRTRSPLKLIDPSSYRAGIKSVWNGMQSLTSGKRKEALPLPLPSGPIDSSHIPADLGPNDITAFDNTDGLTSSVLGHADEQVAPLATDLQHAHIHANMHSDHTGFPLADVTDDSPPFAHNRHPALHEQRFCSHVVTAMNDTAPLYPDEQSASPSPEEMQCFDFGFSPLPPPLDLDVDDGGFFLQQPVERCMTTDDQHWKQNDTFGGRISSQCPVPHAMMHPAFHVSGAGVMGVTGNGSSSSSDAAMFPHNTAEFAPQDHPYSFQPNHFAAMSVASAQHHLPISSPPPQQFNFPVTPPPHARFRSPSLATAATPPTVRSRKSTSSIKHATTPSSTRRPAGAGGSRRSKSASATPYARARSRSAHNNKPADQARSGFVNFTPQDKSKILGGVAPSGSSKTRARREKEAAEVRRKLSQAAMRAVVRAGGDLGVLRREGGGIV